MRVISFGIVILVEDREGSDSVGYDFFHELVPCHHPSLVCMALLVIVQVKAYTQM